MVGNHFLNMHRRWNRVGRSVRVHHLHRSVAREPEPAIARFSHCWLVFRVTRLRAVQYIKDCKRYFTRGESQPSFPFVRCEAQDSTFGTEPARSLIVLNQGEDSGARQTVLGIHHSELTVIPPIKAFAGCRPYGVLSINTEAEAIAGVAQLHRLLRSPVDVMSELGIRRKCPDPSPAVSREELDRTTVQSNILSYTPISEPAEIVVVRAGALTVGRNPEIALNILGKTHREPNLPKRTAVSLFQFDILLIFVGKHFVVDTQPNLSFGIGKHGA